jgi:hypothetical protein
MKHPQLTLKVVQRLEVSRAIGLNVDNVASFYANLKKLYELHNYNPSHIWNCDEFGAQTGCGGQGWVLAKKGSHSIHIIIPKEQEWSFVFTCITSIGTSIPNFYIFKGKRMWKNYIQCCENGVTMTMQSKAWMTNQLFTNWIVHFVKLANVNTDGISHSN